MTSWNRLLRTLTEREHIAGHRFRPAAEALEAREVPSGSGPIDIALTKSVDNMCYSPGALATYHYAVTNTGTAVSLANVSLTDDNGTPNNTSDDFTLTPGVNVAATDDNGTVNDTTDDFAVAPGALLKVGHTWSFQHDVTLPNVTVDTTITNVAVVTASPALEGTTTTVSATASATLEICVPTPPTPLVHGDTATIGFWNNKNGQALIKSLNGGPTATNLADWLATNFPHLYGADAGANNLTGKTNADVAALFQKFFSVKGPKTDAQILGAALAVYVTDFDLAGGAAVKYGFNVTTSGTAEKTYNVGSYGSEIGLKDNTEYTVLQLLQQADLDKANGTYDANAFNVIFDGINQMGDIK